ncbi:MAG: ABC transporter substrate-binding protein [Acidimicrobiia bacterium]|nr:ABC transporter substrate-binding protein [Acidimicrobiia bacterium]
MWEGNVRSRSARILAVLAAVGLLTVSCGSRVDTDEAGDQSFGGEAPESDGGGGEVAEGEVSLEDDLFGTLESPCGPTPDDMELTDPGVQGVTADSITVATIADPGGPVPGLNQGIFDSMDAFADWCNDQGGINGRELIVEQLDAAILQYRERVLEACDFAFALVGGGGTLDQLGAQEAVDCGLVDVAGFTVSPQKAESDRLYQPQPNPISEYLVGAAQWMYEQDPDAAQYGASLYTNVETTETQQRKHQEAYESVGFDFVYDSAVNINEVNWAPTVVAMRDAGVEYLTLTSSYEEGVNLLKAMSEQGFDPTFVDFEANFYNPEFPPAAGGAAEGAYVRITIWPFEDADQNPATQEYLQALRATNGDDTEPELLGAQSFSAGLMFATAMKELGDDISREALLEELSTITEWDGGGLHGTSNPAENKSAGCFVLMEVVGDGFERVHPDEGLDCSEDNLDPVEGDYGAGAAESGS